MTVFYIDVSHYDWDRYGGNLNWSQLKASGIEIAFIRSTYGDPNIFNTETRHFVDMALGAKQAGIKVGGYHNLIKGDVASIKRQVGYFVEQLELADADFAMVDVEPYQALIDKGLVPRTSDAEVFAQEFRLIDPSKKLAVYLPQWVWSGHLGKPDLRNLMTSAGGPLVASNYPLGALKENYVSLYAKTKEQGWQSYGNVTPEIWQYSSNAIVPGASTITDVNAFKGTVTELQSRLKEGTMAWVLTKNLEAFRTQMNANFPHRDKASDGTIGDLAHQNESASGHNPDETGNAECDDSDTKNEVRAIDIDSDTGDPAISAEDIVQHLLKLARAGKLSFIRYIIYNRRIWSASTSPAWAQRSYTGASAHTEHIHLSGACSQSADELASANYHLEDLVEMTQDEFTTFYANAIMDANVQAQQKARAWQYVGGGLPADQSSTLATLTSTYNLVKALAAQVASESTNPTELAAALNNLPTAGETAEAVVDALGGADIDVIVQTLHGVLTPERVALLKAAL